MLKKISATVLAAAAIALTFTGVAQAETNPRCSSGVTQIGSTAYIKLGSATIASVKQFKGCNKNWAYTYVWDSWLSSHKRDFYVYTGVWTKEGQAARDQVSGAKGQREVWSSGANTLDVCTSAKGSIQSVESGYWENAHTDLRC